MKVVFKVKSFPEASETFVLNSIIQSIKNGDDVVIITEKLNSITNSSQAELFETYDILSKVVVYSTPKQKSERWKLALKSVINPIILFYYVKYFFLTKRKSLDYFYYLKFYSNYRNIDAFHVHFEPALKPLAHLKSIGYIVSKIVVTFHGYDAHFIEKGKLENPYKRWFTNAINTITVNSIYLKDKLVSKGFNPEVIKIVPIGIDVNLFKNSKTNSTITKTCKLITVGRLIPLKGQEYGIRAVKQLIDKGYAIEYDIIGNGPNLEALKRLSKALDIEKQVVFKGKLSQTEIKTQLSQSNIFLMTSTVDENNRREAFGLVSIEAQAMGLPVIGFNSGGFVETIKDNQTGFLVKDKDVDGLVQKVEDLITDSNLLTKMSNNAKVHAHENFSLESEQTSYLKYYK